MCIIYIYIMYLYIYIQYINVQYRYYTYDHMIYIYICYFIIFCDVPWLIFHHKKKKVSLFWVGPLITSLFRGVRTEGAARGSQQIRSLQGNSRYGGVVAEIPLVTRFDTSQMDPNGAGFLNHQQYVSLPDCQVFFLKKYVTCQHEKRKIWNTVTVLLFWI